MSEETHIPSTNTGKRLGVRKKDPTLSQQLKEQAGLIAELSTQLQQKERELAELLGQRGLMDELVCKLQEAEQVTQSANQQALQQAGKIEELTEKLQDREMQVMTAVEQAELIDGLTVKLQEVEIKLAAASLQNKHIAAQNLVKTHMVAGMSLGLLPAPLFDIAALTGTQLHMLRSLSKHYGIDFDEQTARAVLTSLVSGALPVLTVVGLSSLAKLIPGIGTVGGGISMVVLSASLIYAVGQVFLRHFEAGGTFHNFDSKHWQAFFRGQFEEGKAFVKGTMDTSKSSVVITE